MDIKHLKDYSRRFTKLRVDRSRGVAPHKPILLLSVIELIAQGFIKNNQIVLSPELIATFLKYWGHLGSEAHNPDIALPFYHLRSDKFWNFLPNPGYELVVESKVRIRTISALKEAIKFAYFDVPLYELMEDSDSRKALTDILITTWFRDKTEVTTQLFQIDSLQDYQNRFREQGGAVYSVEDLKDEQQTILRDVAFRKELLSLYDHQCAFCRLKIISSDGQTIVDGAHIKPFSEFRDNRLNNGLSLCKNHHWAFDHGWFGISPAYEIVVPPERLFEVPVIGSKPIRDFQGQSILMPNQSGFLPRADALEWHRQKWQIEFS